MSFVFRTAEFEAARCAWEGRSPPGRKPCRLLVVCVVIPLETGELGVEVRVEHRHGVFPEIPILLIAHFELGELHHLVVQGMVLDRAALDLLGAAPAHEEPGTIERRREEPARGLVRAVSEDRGRLHVLERQDELLIAVTQDRRRVLRAVLRVELGDGLDQDRAPDLAASDDRERVGEIRDREVGEVIEQEPDGEGEHAARAPVRLVHERLQRLADEEVGQGLEAVVDVAHGHEEGDWFMPHAGDVDLARMVVHRKGGIESQAPDLLREDSQDR